MFAGLQHPTVNSAAPNPTNSIVFFMKYPHRCEKKSPANGSAYSD